MKKKHLFTRVLVHFMEPKFIKIMKLSVFLLLICTLSVNARVYSQTRISMNATNSSLRKVLHEIESKSDYTFFYNEDFIDLEKTVSYVANNEMITDIFAKLASMLGLNFQVLDNKLVVITKAVQDKKTVTGKVTNAQGEPLPGVTISVKGTTRGTLTDAKGVYVLTLEPNDKILVFSSIGMEKQEIAISNRGMINIVMAISAASLDEIIVNGYQTISKERVTGAFSTVKAEQLEKPSSSIAQRLIGTTAGMQATLDADGNPTFEIRGQTSLNANRDVLVVIDGFPTQKGFTSVNPNDVETVTVLKDAAAASIWGAKAANGVIVITTKKPKGNMPLNIQFNTFLKVGNKLDLNYVRPMADANQTIDYELASFNKWGARAYSVGNLDDGYYRNYTPTQQLMWDNYVGKITTDQMNTQLNAYRGLDNSKQISDNLLTNPSTQQYNLTIMGGTDRITNFLSLLHENNNSNFTNTNNTRDVISYRNTARITKWLDFEMGATLAYSKYNSNGVGLSNIQSWVPQQMLINPDGSYTNIPNGTNYLPAMSTVPFTKFPYPFFYNPIQEINNRSIVNRNIDTRVTGALTIKLIKGMSLESRVQYEYNNSLNKNIYNENTYTVESAVNVAASWNRTTNAVTLNLPKGGFLDQNRSEVKALNVRNQLNYRKSFGKHDIVTLAGVEVSNNVTQSFSNPRTYGYDDNKLSVGTLLNGPGGSNVKVITNWLGSNETFAYTNSFGYRTERYFDAYANASYSYASKYTLSGSIRTDASNFITDDPKYRYSPFWSVGAGWEISKEPFMRNVDFVDKLSARLTFGYNGNADRTTSFQPLISPSATINTYTLENTTAIASLGNPTLRWEKTGTWNLGFDYSLFKGVLYGNIELYTKNTKDLIATISIPSVNGSTSSKMNNADMTNKGIELVLGTTQYIKDNDIWWRGSVNFAYNKNTITKLFIAQIAASSLTGSGTYVQGYNSQEMWSFKYAGIKNEGTEAAPNWQPQVQGPGTTTYNFTGWTPGDGRDYLLHMGTRVAPFTLGFTSSLKVYDFNLSFIVTGKFGHVFARQSFNYPVWWNGAVIPNQKYSEVVNGDPMKIVPLPLNRDEARFYFWDRFYPYLSYLVESASHLRMQEINLTYSLPLKYSKAISMNRIQFYAQGNDLFTIVANKYGEDPEYPVGTLKPQPKYTIGLKFDL